MPGHPNEKYENEDQNSTLVEEKGLKEECVKTCKQLRRRLQSWWKKEYKIRAPVFCALVVISISIIISVIAWRTKEPSCPKGWVGYEGSCYYFSETKATWYLAQTNCSSYGASLAGIDAPWELDFVMRYKGNEDHWIGLRREDKQPWKWTDGSLFSNWFNITADGFCVYLRKGPSSTWCDTQRHWICKKILKGKLEDPPRTEMSSSGD